MLRSDPGPVERHQLAIVVSGKRARHTIISFQKAQPGWAFCCSKVQPYGDENPTSGFKRPLDCRRGFKRPLDCRRVLKAHGPAGKVKIPLHKSPAHRFKSPRDCREGIQKPTGLPGRNSKGHETTGKEFKRPRDCREGIQKPTGLPGICDLLPQIPFVWGGVVQFIV